MPASSRQHHRSSRPLDGLARTRRRLRPRLERVEPRALLSGSTYTVTSLGGDGPGSGLSGDLRYAIGRADQDPGSTITFTVTGKIALTKALPDLGANMTIIGPGASSLMIQGGGKTSNFSILTIDE